MISIIQRVARALIFRPRFPARALSARAVVNAEAPIVRTTAARDRQRLSNADDAHFGCLSQLFDFVRSRNSCEFIAALPCGAFPRAPGRGMKMDSPSLMN